MTRIWICNAQPYRLRAAASARPAEIKAFLNNTLDPARAAELRDKMLAVGLPI